MLRNQPEDSELRTWEAGGNGRPGQALVEESRDRRRHDGSKDLEQIMASGGQSASQAGMDPAVRAQEFAPHPAGMRVWHPERGGSDFTFVSHGCLAEREAGKLAGAGRCYNNPRRLTVL